MNPVQATRFAQRVLDDPHASKVDKGECLSWLFHLVGDIHQLLHAATLCTVELFPKGDHGGNWITTVQKKEFYAVWDVFSGSPGIKICAVKNKAIALIGNQELRKTGEEAATDLNV